MFSPTVSLFLKAPREGLVKTRLASAIGFPAATRAYRRLVEHQLRQLPAAWPTHIHFAPAEDGPLMRAWLGPAHSYSPQAPGDLGARLTHALRTHFAERESPLFFIGGDCPYLTSECFRQVAEKLHDADAVLIPANDGGYCLLALARAEEHVFSQIAWSTPSVAEQTRQRMREKEMRWVELAPLEDVDDAPSWARALRAFPELADD